MRSMLLRALSGAALCGLLVGLPAFAGAQDLDECSQVPSVPQGTQGFEECRVRCFTKTCGAAGLRCPTRETKLLYKRKCYGQCREMMQRQADLRRLIQFCRSLRLERERAARYRKRLILRHNMWVAKRKLVHKLRMQYEAAKARRQAAAAQAYYRRMKQAHLQQMTYMRQKLQMKERFYMARVSLRHKQRMELISQVGRLRKQLIQAKNKGDVQRLAALRKVILAKKKKAVVAEKKEKKLKVDFHQTRVKRSDHEIKEVKVKKKQLHEAKAEAKKANNQKRLEDLAKRLGELAGKQAALTRKAELERQKLRKAKVAYAAISKQQM